MTLAYWCVLVAGVLPYLAILPAQRGVDNHNPRDSRAAKSGIAKRAWAAHLNALEAFPFFAAAVILAYQFGAPRGWLDALAVTFVGLRVLYIGAYWSDRATLRSTIWALALLTVLAIFALPVLA